MNNYKELLRLIQSYPELPIIPVVDCELCGDDCGYYFGSFGNTVIGEYATYNDRYYDDRDEFKEDYFNFNAEKLCDKFYFHPYTTLDTTPKFYEKNKKAKLKLEEYLDSIAEKIFQKAIIVYIKPIK